MYFHEKIHKKILGIEESKERESEREREKYKQKKTDRKREAVKKLTVHL